jgi:hypothetical protein
VRSSRPVYAGSLGSREQYFIARIVDGRVERLSELLVSREEAMIELRAMRAADRGVRLIRQLQILATEA